MLEQRRLSALLENIEGKSALTMGRGEIVSYGVLFLSCLVVAD